MLKRSELLEVFYVREKSLVCPSTTSFEEKIVKTNKPKIAARESAGYVRGSNPPTEPLYPNRAHHVRLMELTIPGFFPTADTPAGSKSSVFVCFWCGSFLAIGLPHRPRLSMTPPHSLLDLIHRV
jgi:hypothetical protein